jgi:hypothetical protein
LLRRKKDSTDGKPRKRQSPLNLVQSHSQIRKNGRKSTQVKRGLAVESWSSSEGERIEETRCHQEAEEGGETGAAEAEDE